MHIGRLAVATMGSLPDATLEAGHREFIERHQDKTEMLALADAVRQGRRF